MSKEDSLLSAVGSGDLCEVRRLLEQDRYLVSCTDTDGMSPLHWACWEGHLEMVRMLISEFGADRNAGDLYNNTSAQVAAFNGKGVIPCQINKQNAFAFQIFTKLGGLVPSVKLLHHTYFGRLKVYGFGVIGYSIFQHFGDPAPCFWL